MHQDWWKPLQRGQSHCSAKICSTVRTWDHENINQQTFSQGFLAWIKTELSSFPDHNNVDDLRRELWFWRGRTNTADFNISNTMTSEHEKIYARPRNAWFKFVGEMTLQICGEITIKTSTGLESAHHCSMHRKGRIGQMFICIGRTVLLNEHKRTLHPLYSPPSPQTHTQLHITQVM